METKTEDKKNTKGRFSGRILTSEEIRNHNRGSYISPAIFRKRNEKRESVRERDRAVVNKLLEVGIDLRNTEANLCVLSTLTNEIHEIDVYKNTNLIPSVAARNRRKVSDEFEYFYANEPSMRDLRALVLTHEGRVYYNKKQPWALKTEIQKFKKKLSNFRYIMKRDFDVDFVMQSIETTYCEESMSFHIHANVYYIPPFFENRQDLTDMHNFINRNFVYHNSSRITNITAVARYPFKHHEVDNMTPEVLAYVYNNTKGLRFFEGFEGFQQFRQSLKDSKLKFSRVKGELVLRLPEEKGARRKKEIEEKEERKERLTKALEENQIFSLISPTHLGSVFSETGILIRNYTKEPKTQAGLDRLIEIEDIKMTERRAYEAKRGVPPLKYLSKLGEFAKNDYVDTEDLKKYYERLLKEDELYNVLNTTITYLEDHNSNQEIIEVTHADNEIDYDFLSIFDEIDNQTENNQQEDEYLNRKPEDFLLSRSEFFEKLEDNRQIDELCVKTPGFSRKQLETQYFERKQVQNLIALSQNMPRQQAEAIVFKKTA